MSDEQDNDLGLTIKELSNSYEELSVLYRMMDSFPSGSIQEACSTLLEEVLQASGLGTAAVLILSEDNNLHAMAFAGDWGPEKVLSRELDIFRQTIDKKRALSYEKLIDSGLGSYCPELSWVTAYPLEGKKRAVGVVIVGGKGDNKPLEPREMRLLGAVTRYAGIAIENIVLHSEMTSLLLSGIESLVKALETSSYWTAGHTERVTEYTLGIGKVMGWTGDKLEKLRISALLHDIGKIATPKEILNKDGKLDKKEREEIKRHAAIGAEILHGLKQLDEIVECVKYHHEHWDDGAKGIFGLTKADIPLMARILTVADAFDALTSDRPYRARKTKEEAVGEIVRCSGTQFDPSIVEAFLSWVESYRPERSITVF
jgi:putative nucleotidyltransferase with HDIG domain